MDLLELYNAMDVLNETSSPSANVNNRSTNNSENSLSNSGSIVEPNNLSQSAAAVVASGVAAAAVGVDGGASTDGYSNVEPAAPPTFPVSLPRLELKLPILSSSSSDSEPEEPSNPTVGTLTVVDGERVASPPPNCAICLGRCKNKCFTDSCVHQFCFKCLCEWSKVKPECPLCKQTFKSIIHNVKSIDQFEEYHVQPPSVQISNPTFDLDFPDMRIFGVVHPGHNRNNPAWNDSTHRTLFFRGLPATLGAALPTSASGSSRSIALPGSGTGSGGSGGGLRNQYVYRGELLDLYRQEYPDAIASSGTLSQLWRRYVYDRKLYAMPVADITGRFRESTARFYRDNPSQIHRLMPWINRDIVCLLRQTQHDVTTVLESINSALTLMNILSPAFRRRLQPTLGTKTAHFIHELNNFARSPYDMIGYDRAVQYSPQTNNENVVIEFTSSEESTDNEHIDVLNSAIDGGHGGGGGGGANNTRSTTNISTSSNASINAINLTIHNRLTSGSNSASSRGGNGGGGGGAEGGVNIQDDSLVIDLRGESDNIDASANRESTMSTNFQDEFQHSLEGDSDMLMMPAMLPSVSENIELTSGSSDECEFVLERKPPHLRTPEMVSLDSATDSDVVFVEESKALNKTSFSSSEGEQNDATTNDHHIARTSATTSTRSKITALVEAKKRNYSSNLVKNEQQHDTQSEIYNVGASTSAASRLSLQKRVDNVHQSGRRLRRDKFALRNTERKSRMERDQEPKHRGKRLGSESSHSSTSSSSTTTTSTTSSTTNSTSSTSDEEYVVASGAQPKKVSGLTIRRRKVRKTKKRKTSNSAATKRDLKNRRKNNNNDNDTSGDDEEEDNGHMGKNFALVMAIGERIKRQNQKHSNKAQTSTQYKKQQEDEQDSEDENAWRLKAVNEPLRKQQQQQVKSSHKSNERKRHRKTASTQSNIATDKEERKEKRRRRDDNNKQQHDSQPKVDRFNTNFDTSSDESDNINLIQLKTKLIGGVGGAEDQEINNRRTIAGAETNTQKQLPQKTDNESHTSSINNETVTTSTHTLDHPPDQPTSTMKLKNSPPPTPPIPNATNNVVESTTKNDTQNYSESSDSNDGDEHMNINENEQTLPSAVDEYHNDQNDDDDSSRNIASTMNLPESNVFVDGTSMSTTTTTTDTILHDAAEQISSAAVNFYNPQQTFNTADFAADNEDNSTNSSSSDSSISSVTTSISSSSNSSSSSSNTIGFVKVEHP